MRPVGSDASGATGNRISRKAEGDLALLHERLKVHFQDLREKRSRTGAVVFALEHGLSEPELALLMQQVASAIRNGEVLHDLWLPLVVYATEIGYEYSGDEYWQTFEDRTPGWVEYGDRHYIRRRFRDFKEAFAGAEPSGPWARQFSIICWPITHAVLPVDLQRHLARLLFEYRRALTSDLLADPDELGKRLAVRSWHASSRFQNFAQNTALLGRVAASLLAGEDERSPYLLESTLSRIADDLSDEHDARGWLRGAKSTAARVRTHGFRPTGGASGSGTVTRGTLAPTGDPNLWLREEQEGWTAYVELPDLSVLAERLPEIAKELSHRRAHVAGVAGPPLARGRLLYPGQRLRLSEWPSARVPLVQVEAGDETTNSLLSDQCVLSTGPRWLFRVRDPGSASEVRGNHVRPGRDYVLLSEDALSEGLPSWIAEAPCGTAGVRAYRLRVPPVLDSDQLDSLRTIGVGVVTDVEIRPAGLVPALWDGEGRAEWLAGECPIVAVSWTRSATQSIWTLDGNPQVIAWPPEEHQIFIRLDDLDPGNHELHVLLTGPDELEPVAEGSFELRVRPPQTPPTSGTFREGLMMLATPVNPSLTELWDGTAVIQVRGPAEVEVRVEASLMDRSTSILARRDFRTALPVEAQDWATLFSRLYDDGAVQSVYDDAETLAICVFHEELGRVALRCEREFAPLRWTAGRGADGPYLRLIDNTEGTDIDVQLSEFAQPDSPRKLQLDQQSRARSKSGGLVTARAGTETTAMILPPTVRHLEDLRLKPRLSTRRRSLHDVIALIRLAERWGSASRPSDPFAERGRVRVLRVIAGHIAELLGGHHWTRLERRIAADDRELDLSALEAAIGRRPHQGALARDVSRWIDHLDGSRPKERAHSLATALAIHSRSDAYRSEDPRFAEFLLRLASAPDSLISWSERDVERDVERVLNAPLLIRAARFLVLAIDAKNTSTVPATYSGWAWD